MADNILPNLQGLSFVSSAESNPINAVCIYDTTKSLGVDSNTSYAALFASMFQVNEVPVGTVVSVQAKIHTEANWHEIWRSTDTTGFLQTYQMPYNYMRVVRISGTGDVKAFFAVFPTDYIG